MTSLVDPPSDASGGAPNGPDELSLVVIQLFKGPVYREVHEKLWEPLGRLRRRVADHVSVLGLRLEIDETDGFAYLRSLRDGESDIDYPRLVARHSLSFTTSLLIALLRKRLLEFDTSSTEARLILSRDQIVDLYRVYAPSDLDDIKLARHVDNHVNRIVELGFLHKLRGSSDQFEVRRILRAFVDGQWLSQFDERLEAYIVGDGAARGRGDDREVDDASRA